MEVTYFKAQKDALKKNKKLSWIYVLSTLLITILVTLSIKSTYAGEINSDILIQLANSERTISKMQPLELDNRLTIAAYIKAYDMLEKQYWAHYGPSGENPWSYILYCDYDYTVAGENLAYDFVDSFRVHQSWMSSELHKKNILNPIFTHVGIAIVDGFFQGKETTLIVQLFGSEKGINTDNFTSIDLDEAIKVLYPRNNALINNKLAGVVGTTIYSDEHNIRIAIDNIDVGTTSISTGTFSIRTEYDNIGVHHLVTEVIKNGEKIDFIDTQFEIVSMGDNKLNSIHIDTRGILKISTSEDMIDAKIVTQKDVKPCNRFNNEFTCDLENVVYTESKLVIIYTNDRSITIPINEILSISGESIESNTSRTVDKPNRARLDSVFIPIALSGLGVFELIRYTGSNKNSSSSYRVIILITGIYTYFTSKIGTII